MNPLFWSFRVQFFAGVLVCAGLLGYALYAQHQLGLDPCPLCIFQRVVFIGMGLVFLVGFLHGPRTWGRKLYALSGFVVSMVGVGIAGRHVWLQNLPADEVPACGPGLAYMLDAFPWRKTLDMVFTGSGECANIDWHFLGLTMPTWTLIAYVLLGVGALWAGFRRV